MVDIMFTTVLSSDFRRLFLVDSGACMSTYSLGWGDWAAVRGADRPRAVTATGSALTIYSICRVRWTH
eukprot:9314890-Heterocapsa_arctica.AAC.1